MTAAEREQRDRDRQAQTLPVIRKTHMCATFRAPVSRPGADTRRECWAAETTDGIWGMERQEGDRYLHWALMHLPTDTLVCYDSTLKNCRTRIARGSWDYRESDPTDGLWNELAAYGAPLKPQEFYREQSGRREGPPCVVMLWFRGTELHRGVFGTVAEAVAWAQTGIGRKVAS